MYLEGRPPRQQQYQAMPVPQGACVRWSNSFVPTDKRYNQLSKKMKTGITGSLPLVQKTFETIGFAKVATSANQAKSYGYLVPNDKIVINRDHILMTAKSEILNITPRNT